MPDEGGNGGREALAQVLSEELSIDIDKAVMEAVDVVLAKLAIRGFIVAPMPGEVAS